jgi:drug/metabolite transporter (DMT)-like permease
LPSRLVAYLLLTLAEVGIAVNVVIGKFAIEEDMPIFLFLGVRFFISSIALSTLMFFKPAIVTKDHPTGKLEFFDWRFLWAQAFTGGFLFNYFFYWGIEYTTAISAGIICSSLPALLAILAWLLLGERISSRQWLAVIFAVLGIVVISLDNTPSGRTGSNFGDFLVLLAMFPEALYSIFSKFSGNRLTSLGSATIVNWMIFLMILPFALLSTVEVYVSEFPIFLWGLIGIGGICSALFYWAWPKGLQAVPTSTAAVFTTVLPITTAYLGWYFLYEPFGRYDAVALILVIISILLGTYPLRR